MTILTARVDHEGRAEAVASPALPVAAAVDSMLERPIRVMHVLYRLQEGGTEYGVIKLVNGLDPALVSSSICSTTPATAVKSLLRPGVSLYECTRRDGNDPLLVWQLFRLFRRVRPDVVHTHAWGTLCEGLIAARLAQVPVVIHGEHGTLQLKPRQARAQRWAWRRAGHLLSVSSRLADRMAERVGIPRDQVTVIRNGVDLSRFVPVDRHEARRAIGLPPDTLVFGAVGRLVPVKNHALLLDAAAELASGGVACSIVIAGDGPLRGSLEDRVNALGLSDRVRLLGHRSDVEQVFAALDVFVLPSRSEGMSNTILEAMASGLPVVATNVGGADELVINGETGLLVPEGSAPALATALRTLATDATRRRAMGRAGRLRIERQFSLTTMIREYEGFYLGAIRGRRLA
jgi:sugar transferase (PEP-CTERM/EpsH1 system associated)